MTLAARIAAAQPPFDPEVAAQIDNVMKGAPPLALFTTLARDKRLFNRFFGGGLLDRGHLTMRQREIVIDRTTGLCRSEYEWGVHIAAFARHVGLTDEQVRSTVRGAAEDACWNDEERLLIRLCDALHRDCNVDDALWSELRTRFSEEAMIELLMLAGFYRTVSYLTNAIRVPLEKTAARFPGK